MCSLDSPKLKEYNKFVYEFANGSQIKGVHSMQNVEKVQRRRTWDGVTAAVALEALVTPAGWTLTRTMLVDLALRLAAVRLAVLAGVVVLVWLMVLVFSMAGVSA